MRIVVTGGSGVLGSRVVSRARGLGHEVVPASRRWGVNVATGEGLARALAGADAVVHAATNPRRARLVDVEGTAQLLVAAAALPRPPHLVYVSIVGCDENPSGYYGAKAAAERLVEAGPLPATIVRPTRFHSSAAVLARRVRVRRPAIESVAAQPVDAEWVARELVDLAAGPAPAGCVRIHDLAGPEVLTLDVVAGAVREHDGPARARVLRLPTWGHALRAFTAGPNLPGPDAQLGGMRFADWLSRQPVGAPR